MELKKLIGIYTCPWNVSFSVYYMPEIGDYYIIKHIIRCYDDYGNVVKHIIDYELTYCFDGKSFVLYENRHNISDHTLVSKIGEVMTGDLNINENKNEDIPQWKKDYQQWIDEGNHS